jgi:thiosulfate dehydrogenase
VRWLAAAVLLAGCQQLTPEQYGEQLFNDPQFAGSQFNQWSCATCHDLGPALRPEVQRIASGGSLENVVRRPSFWGGKELRLIDAASFCYVYFMRGPEPLKEDEPRSRALYAYLATLGKDEHPPAVPVTIVLNATELMTRGPKEQGETVYRQACEVCHGQTKTGFGRSSELASILPNVADEYDRVFPGIPPSLVFIEKVRHGQFFRVGGNMPLFSLETLSDDNLAALLTYLGK